MGWKKILILTFKPAVEDAWQKDLMNHMDFQGWRFISKKTEQNLNLSDVPTESPLVCFGSFQDYGKRNKSGKIKAENEWVHRETWDCIIFDEYHFGAWNEKSQNLVDKEEESIITNLNDEFSSDRQEQLNELNELEEKLPIKSEHFLYLSGTPFRAISNGEFLEDQIFNWTYSDEQAAKENWSKIHHQDIENPYESLPQMVMMTYELPETLRKVAVQGEFDGFDLSVFFSAIAPKNDDDLDNPEKTKFKFQNEVQKWLDWIRNGFITHNDTATNHHESDKSNITDEMVQQLKNKANLILPFADTNLLGVLNHTFWFLPTVASCYAMKHLLEAPQNKAFYGQYDIIVAAGIKAGVGLEALKPVEEKLKKHDLYGKSITLSCGKLTTGVSVKQWSGIFMLRNCSSPETYFQAAFRVQTPWSERGLDDEYPNKNTILKKMCYVFDFAPNRALKQVSDYAAKLTIENTTSILQRNSEQMVEEFINFLPILAYDGNQMKQINAQEVLDFAITGTSGSLLARRWESSLLLHVDNETLERLLGNEGALVALEKALDKIEGFRNINEALEKIVSRNENIKKLKSEQQLLSENDDLQEEKISDLEKEINKEKKEQLNLRKKIQEKLIQFITKIPLFMYLTDYREQNLHDVITQLEPELFQMVTGLSINDFQILVDLKLFNTSMMNDAIYKFQRYEGQCLHYLKEIQSDIF